MRLILFDLESEQRRNFYPLALSRPIWELRCGITSLGQKMVVTVGASDIACFVPPYMAEAYRERADWPVNNPGMLDDDDLFLVDTRVKASQFQVKPTGPSEVGLTKDGRCLYARITRDDRAKIKTNDINELLTLAAQMFPTAQAEVPLWNYTWELVLANPDQITEDFKACGRSGIEGNVEQPNAVRGDAKNVYIAPGAVVHPMVVIDAENGPVYLDEDVEVHPFSRIEGPCYVGPKSILLGAKCRGGNSLGPACRIGGEVEESIIQGYSNKYHDGFLGHAYVGEWVNLGALTTNSDLKNDYGNVELILDGKTRIDTGSKKVGALIGDHTKTSIGTLFNTGAYVGAMGMIMATGKPLSKFIPDFAWLIEGNVTKGFGRKKMYETAKFAMSRRKQQWTEAQQAMWEAIFKITAPPRDVAIQRGRHKLSKK